MPQCEGTKVWILLALLRFTFMAECSSVSRLNTTANEQSSGHLKKYAMKDYIGSHCEVLINRGFPPGVYYMDRTVAVKMGWMLGWGAFEMYCEKAADVGWMVIQRRKLFGERENFTKSWNDYSRGFGDLNGEFWLGNEWIHRLTADFGPYELRIELEDRNGKMAWAQYSTFRVMTAAEGYSIFVGDYTGNATDALRSHRNISFSTYDHYDDKLDAWFLFDHFTLTPCVLTYGGGWWFMGPGKCFDANLNGDYNKDQKGESKERIVWNGFGGNGELKSSKMMIRSMLYRSLSTIKSHSEM